MTQQEFDAIRAWVQERVARTSLPARPPRPESPRASAGYGRSH